MRLLKSARGVPAGAISAVKKGADFLVNSPGGGGTDPIVSRPWETAGAPFAAVKSAGVIGPCRTPPGMDIREKNAALRFSWNGINLAHSPIENKANEYRRLKKRQ